MNTVLITGCNRGIGLEFSSQYLAAGWRVHATCRNPAEASALLKLSETHPCLQVHRLDVADEDGIRLLAASLQNQDIDILINNAGFYPAQGRDLQSVKSSAWVEALKVNTIAPALITREFLPHLIRGEQKKVVILSSKVGSIEDNQSGGSYAYRSSKTAVNQVVKSLSIDLAPQGICVVSLHPGWVKTAMGGPNALISSAESVAGMRKVVSNLTSRQSGQFLNFDGARIPW